MKQQKRFYSRYVQAPPARRPLKIFASDPMEGRAVGNRTMIEIGNEKLAAGPRGSRIEVIDYDGSTSPGVFYRPVNLDDHAILMQGGLEPTESDPRFHQQMVYAVSMKVIENFERALGRKIYFRGGRALRLFPHAFRGANAYYNRRLHAILFGYFRADTKNPGRNLPGQNVFTCLSHDIIAHELTHALVDRLRRDFLVFTNHDVAAFHEGFADIVAIFQHFTFPEILRRHIQATRTDLRSSAGLVALAQQFGWATGKGRALRSAIDRERRDSRVTSDPASSPSRSPTLYQTVFEPHERGSILVAAVFDGFFNTYQGRIQDLVRIATGGTGRLPEGDMHPDLVSRIANEASRTAQSVLNMCIRAFEYLPPVDITFGDYLRALVTADYELNPSDELSLRANMIEAFRSRGIYPENVRSLAEESLLWENAPSVPDPLDPQKPPKPKLPPLPVNLLGTLQQIAPAAFSREAPEEAEEGTPSYAQSYRRRERDVDETIARELQAYAKANAEDLGLDPGVPIQVEGFHSVFRVGQDGQLVIEVVAQYGQQDESKKKELGGLSFRGGTTVIAGADGTVRYIIAKPISSPGDAAAGVRPVDVDRRLKAQKRFVSYCQMADPGYAYADEDLATRFERRMDLAAIHQRVR